MDYSTVKLPGYKAVRHEEVKCEKETVLVYDVMEKMVAGIYN